MTYDKTVVSQRQLLLRRLLQAKLSEEFVERWLEFLVSGKCDMTMNK